MSVLKKFANSVADVARKPVTMLGLAGMTFGATQEAKAQDDLASVTFPTVALGYQGSESAYKDGMFLDLGMRVNYNWLELSAGYQYYFKDPNKLNYNYNFSNPWTGQSGGGSHTFIPSRGYMMVGVRPPIDARLGARFMGGLQNNFGGQLIDPWTMNVFARAEMKIGLFKESSPLRVDFCPFAEMTKFNSKLYDYNYVDKKSSFDVGAKLVFGLNFQ